MTTRMIFGTVLTLALSLTHNLVNPGLSAAMPLMKGNSPRNEGFSLEPVSPPKMGTPLPPSIWETDNPSLHSAPRYNRFEPGPLSDRLTETARHYLKTPYRRGGSLQTGRSTDCSGFVQYIYKKANINLPRASVEQAQVGKVAARRMDFAKLAAGDLLFFRDGRRHIGHVGIYLGEGKMIHASSHRRGVTVSDLRQDYYQGAFVVARRLLEGAPGGTPPATISSKSPN